MNPSDPLERLRQLTERETSHRASERDANRRADPVFADFVARIGGRVTWWRAHDGSREVGRRNPSEDQLFHGEHA